MTKLHKVRTEYVGGLFELRICDPLQMVAVVGPRRHGRERDRMSNGEVNKLRQYAIDTARRKYERLLGYELDLTNCRSASAS